MPTGTISVLNVRVGSYTVAANMSGFKDQKQEKIEVALGAEKTVDFKLQLATVSETVEVVATSPDIDVSSGGTAQNIATQIIETLPTINRSITDFARISPFVNPTTLGSNSDQAHVDRRPSQPLQQHADRRRRQQRRVRPRRHRHARRPDRHPADQPRRDPGNPGRRLVRTTCGRVASRAAASTSSLADGTNSLHGTGYIFGRSESLIGSIPGIATTANPTPADTKVGTFSDKQSGFSLGGPIVKNKAFYFGNADFQRKLTAGRLLRQRQQRPAVEPNDAATVAAVVQTLKTQYGFDPGGLDEFSRPQNNDKVFVRTDFNLSSKNRLTARVNYVNGTQYVGTPTTTSYLLPDRYYSIQDKTTSSVGQLDTTLGGATFNEFRITYQRERNVRGDQPGFGHFPSTQVDMPSGASILFGTETSSQANALNQDIVEINDDITMVRGHHTFTVGTHNELFKFYNLFIQNFYGTYRFCGPTGTRRVCRSCRRDWRSPSRTTSRTIRATRTSRPTSACSSTGSTPATCGA